MRGSHRFFSDNAQHTELGAQSVRGGAATLGGRALNSIIQVCSVLALARLLSPEDYGLVGMVAAIIGFVPMMVSLGTPDVITQRPSITEAEVGTLFWISLSVAGVLAVLLAVASPLIAKFYGEPRLIPIAAVSGLAFIASALHYHHCALLRRAMLFHDVAAIDTAANLLSSVVAILMAYYGLHYWAIAMRPVTSNLFTAVGAWWRTGWIPQWPSRNSDAKKTLKLGSSITGFTFVDFLGRSADRVAVGHTSGASALGLYQNTLFIYDSVLETLVVPLHGVGVAGLSKALGNLTELRRLWSKALTTLGFFVMPLFALLSITGDDFVSIMLGSKWASAGPLLCILALRGLPHCLERTLGWLHVAAGRPDRWMRWGFASTCIHLTALFFALPFGPRGVVISYVLCMYSLFIPAVAYAGKPLGIRVGDVFRLAWRPMVGALLAAVIGFVVRQTILMDASSLIRTLLLTVLFGFTYFVLVVGVFRLTEPVQVLVSLFRDSLPEKWMNRFSRSSRH